MAVAKYNCTARARRLALLPSAPRNTVPHLRSNPQPARATPQQQLDRPPLELVRLHPDVVAAGGLDIASQAPEQRDSFAQFVADNFLPVSVDYPGVRVLNIDPPVISVDDFLPPADCEAFIQAAQNTGEMKSSRVGNEEGQAYGGQQTLRTSTTLAMTQQVLAAHPELGLRLRAVLERAVALLQLPPQLAGEGTSFTRPEAGQLSFELPQVAHYNPGQHFLAHEDAFPVNVALTKGLQRRATLLVYLNDVSEGGATHFEHLELGVQPKKGRALLFFPSFAGGRPDSRTLHTAQDAVDEKWITQLWVSMGLRQKAPSAPAAAGGAGGLPPLPFDALGSKKGKRKKGGKKK